MHLIIYCIHTDFLIGENALNDIDKTEYKLHVISNGKKSGISSYGKLLHYKDTNEKERNNWRKKCLLLMRIEPTSSPIFRSNHIDLTQLSVVGTNKKFKDYLSLL